MGVKPDILRLSSDPLVFDITSQNSALSERNTVNCDEKIHKLKQTGPLLTRVVATNDMGCEFSAVVSAGVIYSESVMLLNHSEGRGPPDEWEAKTDDEAK